MHRKYFFNGQPYLEPFQFQMAIELLPSGRKKPIRCENGQKVGPFQIICISQ